MQQLQRKAPLDREVSDEQAEKIVNEFFGERKKQGRKPFDMIELYNATHVPIEQLHRIVTRLEKVGIITPHE